jgi:hypothetical protein
MAVGRYAMVGPIARRRSISQVKTETTLIWMSVLVLLSCAECGGPILNRLLSIVAKGQ